ncbi:uncharacterized mitochondrial protein-like protein [Tanacetum coccineum]
MTGRSGGGMTGLGAEGGGSGRTGSGGGAVCGVSITIVAVLCCDGTSVSSARTYIDDLLLPTVGSPTRWVKVVLIKINIFAWKVCLDKLPTRLNLSLCGIDIPSIVCPNCSLAGESCSHLFFSCSMARLLWRKVARWWDFDIPEFSSYEEWITWFKSIRIPKVVKDVLEGVFYVKQKDNGIFISQDKYVTDILKKYDFATVKTASTPMETNKALLKDEEAADVDVHLYRSMVGSLMYLTTSRPDIMFAVCACARFQVTSKTSHLHVVKRIFRYLKGHPKLGLWYPRDSSFDLEAFSDSDYAGASLDRKSTTGGCQFLRRRLISWQCEKQTIVANSTTEAEYVTVANCCGQSSRPIPLITYETVIKKWEDRMERAATTTSSLEAEQDSSNINRTQSMATLNESFPQGTDLGSGPRCQDTILGVQKLKLDLRLHLNSPMIYLSQELTHLKVVRTT